MLKNGEKQLMELLLFESKTMVAKMQFKVVMLIRAMFLNDQGEVKSIFREKSHNIEKKLKQHREMK